MQSKAIVPVAIILSLFMVTMLPTVAEASTPTLSPPSGALPSVTYYTSSNHYTITDTQWRSFFTAVYDNTTYVSYNWANNTTQFLILFDLGYQGLNPYGLQIILGLSAIGFPSVQNFTQAFNNTKNMKSQVSGYSDIAALNAGAYPGFSWSKPKIKPVSTDYMEAGVIAAIVAASFVLYFVFNRKR